MKKILSLILAGLMTLSSAAFVAADDAAATSASDTEAFAIEFLADLGIYHGKSSTEFVAAAADPIERYQMALFVARMSTGWVDDYKWDYDYKWEDGTANNTLFADLEGTAAADYLGAISYANQKGIIEGYSATKFGPTDGITYRDALTMVVRTLGYTGLAYPWGYIQTAVELGLTKDVDVAYTANLNRGQVAVILYNAMFAATKSGSTLAKKIFDVDFGWKNIIIVATDEGFYAPADKANMKGGLVAFKIMNDNGTIQDKAYWVKASDLELAGHEEEIELGAVYAALFTIDKDLVSIKQAKSLNFMTVVNNGKTDNEGKAYEKMPVAAALANYTLVKDLDAAYVSDEVQKLVVVTAGKDVIYVDDATMVGIDKTNNNIVKWDAASKTWKTEWYYNLVLDRYYQYTVAATTSGADANKVDDGVIYINWMDEAEFTKWYNETIKVAKETVDVYALTTDKDTMLANSAYAKLRLYDLDGDDVAEYATYKKYAIGYFSNTTKKCTHGDCNTDRAAYKITSLDDVEVYMQFVEGSHKESHTDEQYAWINLADGVTGFKNADGTYNKGVVVYNVNEVTGEIEIVKYISKDNTDDKDSYIVEGILQQYSTTYAYLTISGQKYYFDYDNLAGDTLAMDNNRTAANRYAVAKELDNYLMQYVTAVICDGMVVDVDLRGDEKDVIVVVGYAGITSDGYIAVYGYKTNDPSLTIFKINSYNGWKRGDYKYNANLAATDNAFGYGSIYEIKSYDKATDSYGVYTKTIEYALEKAVDPITITYEAKYRIYKDSVDATPSGDTYVVLTKWGSVYVAKNVLTTVEDVKVLYKDGNKFVVYAVDPKKNTHLYKDGYEVGYILYDRDTAMALDAAYDDAIGDWYLLGSTQSVIRATNLLTGNVDQVYTMNNVELKDGCIYKTLGAGKTAIVINNTYGGVGEFDSFIHDALSVYGGKYPDVKDPTTNKYYSKYTNGTLYNFITDENLTFKKSDSLNAKIVDELGLVNANNADIHSKMVAALLPKDNVKVYAVKVDGKGMVHVDLTKVDALKDNTVYTAKLVVYDKNAKSAVVYVDLDKVAKTAAATFAADTKNDLIKSNAYWTLANERRVELDLTYAGDVVKTYDDLCNQWKINSVTLSKVGIEFKMDAKDHDEAAALGLGIGVGDPAKVAYDKAAVKANDKTYVYGNKEIAIGAAECENNCGLHTSLTLTAPVEFTTTDDLVWTATVEFDFNGVRGCTVVFTYTYNAGEDTGALTYECTNLPDDISTVLGSNVIVLGKHE